MSISEFVQSPAYKKFMAYVYGFGAAVAILGALFKILHLPGASVMLICGLGVEALIFALSSFEPPHEIPDWSLVYPELIGLEPEEGHGHHGGGGGGGTATSNVVGGGSELSALVTAGAIEQKTIDELSEGVKRLASTTSQMADISDAATATKAYISNVKVASDSLDQFSAVQASAVDAGSKFADSCAKLNSNVSSQIEQSNQMSQNMGAVNAAYATQLKGINSQIESTEKFVSGMKSVSAELESSADGVKEYKNQVKAAAETMNQFQVVQASAVSEGAKYADSCAKVNTNFASQVELTAQLTQNMGNVNAAYEAQLKGLNSQLKSTEQLSAGLSTISSEIAASVEGVKEYRTQIQSLTKTVSELNSIYGNMLSAVTNR